MSDKTEWSFTDHQGRPLPVWASNEVEAVNEANRIADERDAETITFGDIEETFDVLFDKAKNNGTSYAEEKLKVIQQRHNAERANQEGQASLSSHYDSNSISWEGNGTPERSLDRNGIPKTSTQSNHQKRGLTCNEFIIIIIVAVIVIGYMAIRG